MEVVLYVILGLLGLCVYLVWSVFAVWVANFKKTRNRVLVFIDSLLVTPLVFISVCLPIQYIYEKRKGLLN